MSRVLLLSNTDKTARVDDEDWPLISRYTWRMDPKGYVVTNSFGTTLRIHRLILNPKKGEQVDHINHNKLDNRKWNLRICNNSENQANTPKRTYKEKFSSIYKGVHYRKDLDKYTARIGFGKTRIHIGHFQTQEEAALAYNAKAIELFGEFAYINILKESDTR